MYALNNLLLFYNNRQSNDVYNSVCEILLQNLSEIPGSTIYDLAELCHVSTATISRFCQKLGYANYSDFKNDIHNSVENHFLMHLLLPLHSVDMTNNIYTYIDKLQESLDILKDSLDVNQLLKIAAALHDADHIHIYPHGTGISAINLQSDLTYGKKLVKVIEQPYEQLEDAQSVPEDTLVMLLLTNGTERNLQKKILSILQQRQIRIIIITNSRHSDYRNYTELNYWFEGLKTSTDEYIFSYILTIISILYRENYFF